MSTYTPNTYHLSLQTSPQRMYLLLLLRCLLVDLSKNNNIPTTHGKSNCFVAFGEN